MQEIKIKCKLGSYKNFAGIFSLSLCVCQACQRAGSGSKFRPGPGPLIKLFKQFRAGLMLLNFYLASLPGPRFRPGLLTCLMFVVSNSIFRKFYTLNKLSCIFIHNINPEKVRRQNDWNRSKQCCPELIAFKNIKFLSPPTNNAEDRLPLTRPTFQLQPLLCKLSSQPAFPRSNSIEIPLAD
jgi:hypothetical protein